MSDDSEIGLSSDGNMQTIILLFTDPTERYKIDSDDHKFIVYHNIDSK